jgi:V/A-type H+-transporting ATPase subunit D
MAKVKLTKNELKKQKDDLKRFTRYLPTLELKKKQLLQEMMRIQARLHDLDIEIRGFAAGVEEWADLFAEPIDLKEFFTVTEIVVEEGNIAGCDIPVFRDVLFEDREYDLFLTPLWIDRGIAAVKEQIRRIAERKIFERQREILKEEIRTTVQRINLFEKVKIPEARETIRVINIFMGDQQTAAVVRGKIAKKKIEKKKAMQRAVAG